MTVYAELVALALADDDSAERPLEDLVADAVALRRRLSVPASSAARLVASLAYDVALVRLCRHTGVAQGTLGQAADEWARQDAEGALAAVLPTLGAALR